MQELQANTEVKVRIGPFVDFEDGFVPETGITLGAADEAELLKHNGAATVDISSNTWAAIAGPDGWYDLTLTITDTNTEGLLTVVVQDDSVCLPVFVHFMVLAQAAWISKYTAKDSGFMGVDVVSLGGAPQSATDLKDFADAGYDPGTNKVQGVVLTDTCTTNTDLLDTEVAAVQTAVDLIQAVTDNLPDGGALTTIDSEIGVIDGIVDDILTDTSTTIPGEIATIDGIVDDILVDTGTTLPATLATIDGIVDDILVDTAEIGAGGVGLDDLGGMSTTMKGQVESEVDDALKALDLDHLINAAESDTPADDSIIAKLAATSGDWSDFDEATDSLQAIRDQSAGVPKGVAIDEFHFFMVLASDHFSAATSKTVDVQIAKDDGSFTNTDTPQATEIGNGVYWIPLLAAETNCDTFTLKCTEGTCDQTTVTVFTSGA